MKRLLLILILLFPQLLAAQTAGRATDPASADPAGCRTGREYTIQTVDRDSLGIDTLRRLDGVGSDLMTLRGGGREGNMVLEVAGFGLTLGRAPETDSDADLVIKYGRVKLYFFNSGEFGFTKLVGVDYGGYAPEEKGFLEQKLGDSFHCAASVMQVQVALNKSRTLYFATDLRFALDNYRLADTGIRLSYEKGRLLPVALDEPADKSKFVTSSLGIPLRLIYKPFKHFQASVIAYSDFGIELTSLHKKPRVEYELSGLRTYRFGVGGTVSYYGIGIFASYGVTPLFKKHAGPECHTFSFGISLLM
ncbi:MAG: hypothetical protein LUC96_11040 [Alistipes sp.]|uniref:hypothetical protein n=1 Tax=Alistipes sp. TaxID=1872444 RepID=UPI0025B9C897|nr:hypothetical protein [Alistipes sp.]MCD8275496.1 hypothetical protein [Alistipes sp.]